MSLDWSWSKMIKSIIQDFDELRLSIYWISAVMTFRFFWSPCVTKWYDNYKIWPRDIEVSRDLNVCVLGTYKGDLRWLRPYPLIVLQFFHRARITQSPETPDKIHPVALNRATLLALRHVLGSWHRVPNHQIRFNDLTIKQSAGLVVMVMTTSQQLISNRGTIKCNI